jgi:pyridine nucleotide-disulfide oxidoreductase family protein
VLLVGAGHAHLEVLRRLARDPRPGLRPCLVSADPRHYYSGMVPGYLAGIYGEAEISFHLPTLAARLGVPFVEGRAVEVDAGRRAVRLEDGSSRPYDLASFNVGSLTAGAATPGVREHAALLKPFSRVRALRDRIDGLAARREPGAARVTVVGGGAGGVEIAFALAAVLDRAGRARRVAVLEGGPRILRGYSERFAARARRALAARGIELATGRRAAAVEPDAVVLEDGERLPSDLTVWLAGPAAPPLFRGSGLPVDGAGFLLVEPSLRCPGQPDVLGAGDCVTLAADPGTPKAGVYAVRQAPLLHASLVAAVEGGEPPSYRPQGSFLSLLNTSDGRALLRWRGVVGHGRGAWWLKDRIDRRFMARYRPDRLPGAGSGGGPAPA